MLLYHVPPDGRVDPGPIYGRKLSRGGSRQSETRALKDDLRVAGWNPNSPVVWLSPGAPVSRTVNYYVVDSNRLDAARLVPTFQVGGYLLHVGAVPSRAVVRRVHVGRQRR